MPTTRTLAILIFEDVEVLDFCGPFEVFSVANRFTEPPVTTTRLTSAWKSLGPCSRSQRKASLRSSTMAGSFTSGASR
jgi:hypothetical protein